MNQPAVWVAGIVDVLQLLWRSAVKRKFFVRCQLATNGRFINIKKIHLTHSLGGLTPVYGYVSAKLCMKEVNDTYIFIFCVESVVLRLSEYF